jgi:hypothetical protein
MNGACWEDRPRREGEERKLIKILGTEAAAMPQSSHRSTGLAMPESARPFVPCLYHAAESGGPHRTSGRFCTRPFGQGTRLRITAHDSLLRTPIVALS